MKKKLKKMKIDLKVNDIVKILAGDDKGKTGKVLNVNRYTGKVKIEGIAIQTRYKKVNPYAQKSAKTISQEEGYIDISNVKKENNNESNSN